jgi:hypothetical protein
MENKGTWDVFNLFLTNGDNISIVYKSQKNVVKTVNGMLTIIETDFIEF